MARRSTVKRFGIVTTGQGKAAHALESIGGRGADARPAWPYVFALFQEDAEDRFDHDGKGLWPALKPETVETKRRKGQDPRIMRVTGALERTLIRDRVRGGVRRKAKLQLRYGTTVFYAQFHQKGTGRMPKRELVVVTRPLEKRITETLERYVSKGDLSITRRRR